MIGRSYSIEIPISYQLSFVISYPYRSSDRTDPAGLEAR